MWNRLTISIPSWRSLTNYHVSLVTCYRRVAFDRLFFLKLLSAESCLNNLLIRSLENLLVMLNCSFIILIVNILLHVIHKTDYLVLYLWYCLIIDKVFMPIKNRIQRFPLIWGSKEYFISCIYWIQDGWIIFLYKS